MSTAHTNEIPLAPHAAKRKTIVSQQTIPGLVLLVDSFMSVIAGGSSYLIYNGWNPNNVHSYVAIVGLMLFINVILFRSSGLYKFNNITAWPRGSTTIAVVCMIAFLIFVVLLFALKVSEEFSRVWVFMTAFTSLVLIWIGRSICKYAIERMAIAGLFVRNIAVVGAGVQCSRFLELLGNEYIPWQRLVGIFRDSEFDDDSKAEKQPTLGDLGTLKYYARRGLIDDVVVALPWHAEKRIQDVVGQLNQLPVRVCLAPDLIGYHYPYVPKAPLGNISVFEITRIPLDGWGSILKAIEDKVLASIILILFLPIMLFIAIGIKITSPGPILFRQARYGYNNQVFTVFKFRTMHYDRSANQGVVQARRRDPRVTPFGRFLRRTSLDELPQLFNVLNGTMSLVGPRPHAVEHNEIFSAIIGGYDGRHKVKPGMTGWAQVNGLRGETRTHDRLKARIDHDIFYIDNWSIAFDFYILLRTTHIVLFDRHAY